VSATPWTKRSQVQQFRLVGDEHPPHVKLHMRIAVTVERFERLHAGQEEQRVELEHTLGAPVQRGPGRVEQMAEMAVELVVGLLGDLGSRLAPQRGAFVGRQVLAIAGNGDRQSDVVGPLPHDRLKPDRIEVLIAVRLDVQHDVGACGLARRGHDGELATAAVGGPGERLLGTRLARGHLHAVGDHEGGVEADTELADQAGPLLGLGRGQRRAECAGAGPGDGAQIVDQLLPTHADAVIGNMQGAGVLVGHDADLGLGRGGEGGIGQCLEAAPVHRVGGIRHQFAQEDLALGIE
jgi:hypothetical protein